MTGYYLHFLSICIINPAQYSKWITHNTGVHLIEDDVKGVEYVLGPAQVGGVGPSTQLEEPLHLFADLDG